MVEFDALLLPFLATVIDGWLYVYTDGACADQSSLDTRYAGFGIYYFDTSPWNVARPLAQYTQTSDRAELRAPVWAIQWAEKPIHIKLDNEYVVNTAAML